MLDQTLCSYFIFQQHSIVIIASLTGRDLDLLKNNCRNSVSPKILLIFDEKIRIWACDFRLQFFTNKVEREVKDISE